MEKDFEKYPKFSENKIKDRRTRIFTLIKRPDACYYYRILTPQLQLARQYGWECKFNTIDPLPHQIQAGIPSTIDHQSVDSSLKNLLDCHTEHIEWADVVIMQRPTCDHHLELMRYIQKEMKKPVVYEADDNYIDVPLHNPGHKYFEPRSEYIKNMIRETDLLTVTTEHLADIYRPLRKGKPIAVCPNSINFETLDGAETTMLKYEAENKQKYFMPMRQMRLGIDNDLYNQYKAKVDLELLKEVKNILAQPDSKAKLESQKIPFSQEGIIDFFQKTNREVRIQVPDEEYARSVNGATIIGWSGSPTHREDLAVITNPLMKILHEDKQLVLGMWGFIHHEWLGMIDRSQLWLFGLVPVKYYYSAHKQVGFTISLCPVNPDQFNRGKSNLKAIESCALGQYTIASKYSTYEGCPPEVPLCETPEEWEKEIRLAVNDSAMRMEVNIRNRQYVEEHYDVARNVDIWKNAYEELI